MRALPAPIEAPAASLLVPETDTERRPTSKHLSFSQLSMYMRCSMQWYFRYVLGLKQKPSVSLSIGKGGHAALEWNTKTKIRTGADAPTEAVLDKASDMMDMYLTEMPESEYEKDVEPGSTKDKFIAATKVFRVRDAPKLRPISAELEFNLDMNQFQHPDAEPLPEPISVVNGKIDLVFDDYETKLVLPGIIRVGIDDFKYAARKKAQAEIDMSPQLTLYAAELKQRVGRWPSKLGIRHLHPGTTKDAPDSLVMRRDPALMTPDAQNRRLARIAFQFRQAARAIHAGIFIPTDNPITCGWCGYRDRCQSSLVDDFEAATIRAQTSPPLS